MPIEVTPPPFADQRLPFTPMFIRKEIEGLPVSGQSSVAGAPTIIPPQPGAIGSPHRAIPALPEAGYTSAAVHPATLHAGTMYSGSIHPDTYDVGHVIAPRAATIHGEGWYPATMPPSRRSQEPSSEPRRQKDVKAGFYARPKPSRHHSSGSVSSLSDASPTVQRCPIHDAMPQECTCHHGHHRTRSEAQSDQSPRHQRCHCPVHAPTSSENHEQDGRDDACHHAHHRGRSTSRQPDGSPHHSPSHSPHQSVSHSASYISPPIPHSYTPTHARSSSATVPRRVEQLGDENKYLSPESYKASHHHRSTSLSHHHRHPSRLTSRDSNDEEYSAPPDAIREPHHHRSGSLNHHHHHRPSRLVEQHNADEKYLTPPETHQESHHHRSSSFNHQHHHRDLSLADHQSRVPPPQRGPSPSRAPSMSSFAPSTRPRRRAVSMHDAMLYQAPAMSGVGPADWYDDGSEIAGSAMTFMDGAVGGRTSQYGLPKYPKEMKPDYRRFCVQRGTADVYLD